MRKKVNIYFVLVSIVLVICIPLISGSKESLNNNSDKDYLIGIYGFPFDWLHLYINNGFSFLWIGFIINIIFYYYVIKFLIWLYNKVFHKKC